MWSFSGFFLTVFFLDWGEKKKEKKKKAMIVLISQLQNGNAQVDNLFVSSTQTELWFCQNVNIFI